MNKKALIMFIIGLLVISGGVFVLAKNGVSRNLDSEIIAGKQNEVETRGPEIVEGKQNEVETRVPENAEEISQVSSEDLILFYSSTCSHCAVVEKYISDNQILSKIDLVQKEVSGDKNNSSELVAKAKKCGIKANSIGVPLLWNNGECLVGDKSIIAFFTQEINAK